MSAPTPAALAAAEEIFNQEEGSITSSLEIAEIIDRHTAPKAVKLDNPAMDVVHQMRIHGGSFARSLGDAMRHADAENMAILTAAFPHIIERYDAMASAATEPEGGEG